MRKSMTRVLLLALILALLCVGAMAAGDKDTTTVTPAESKIYTVTPLDKNDEPLTAKEDGHFEDVEKFQLTYTATEAGEQLVMLLLNGTAPTKDNIYYIDQQSSMGGTCTFTIYPKQLTSGTYKLIVASQNSDTAATIEYEAAYVLGDVNNDGRVNSQDASWTLQIALKKLTPTATQKLAADVNLDGKVNSQDASYILQKAIKTITSFEEIQRRGDGT